jgi:hypothetical protein
MKRRSPYRLRTLKNQEDQAWKKWNREQTPPDLTPEQILIWLDQTRSLMFEVWRRNPALRRKYERRAAI